MINSCIFSYPIFQFSITPLFQRSSYLEPQEEQFEEEHDPQEEPAVLLKFPPTEKAKADIIRSTFLLLHSGQEIFSEDLKTSFSNSWPQPWQ